MKKCNRTNNLSFIPIGCGDTLLVIFKPILPDRDTHTAKPMKSTVRAKKENEQIK